MFTRSIAVGGFVSPIYGITVATDGFIYIVIPSGEVPAIIPQKTVFVESFSKIFGTKIHNQNEVIAQIINNRELLTKLRRDKEIRIPVPVANDRTQTIKISLRFVEEFIKKYKATSESSNTINIPEDPNLQL